MDAQDLNGLGIEPGGVEPTPDYNPAAFFTDATHDDPSASQGQTGGDDSGETVEDTTSPDPTARELAELRELTANQSRALAAVQERNREAALESARQQYEATKQRRREEAQNLGPDEQFAYMERAHEQDLNEVRQFIATQQQVGFQNQQITNMSNFIDQYGKTVALDDKGTDVVALDEDNLQIVRNLLQAAPRFTGNEDATRFGAHIAATMQRLGQTQKRLNEYRDLAERTNLQSQRQSRVARGADAVAGGGGSRAPKQYEGGSNAHLMALLTGQTSD